MPPASQRQLSPSPQGARERPLTLPRARQPLPEPLKEIVKMLAEHIVAEHLAAQEPISSPSTPVHPAKRRTAR
jgi:hypothetical protein